MGISFQSSFLGVDHAAFFQNEPNFCLIDQAPIDAA